MLYCVFTTQRHYHFLTRLLLQSPHWFLNFHSCLHKICFLQSNNNNPLNNIKNNTHGLMYLLGLKVKCIEIERQISQCSKQNLVLSILSHSSLSTLLMATNSLAVLGFQLLVYNNFFPMWSFHACCSFTWNIFFLSHLDHSIHASYPSFYVISGNLFDPLPISACLVNPSHGFLLFCFVALITIQNHIVLIHGTQIQQRSRS